MTTADLWNQYDGLIGHISTTEYVERGENVGGYLGEQRKLADLLREEIIGSALAPDNGHVRALLLANIRTSAAAGFHYGSGPTPHTPERIIERKNKALRDILTFLERDGIVGSILRSITEDEISSQPVAPAEPPWVGKDCGGPWGHHAVNAPAAPVSSSARPDRQTVEPRPGDACRFCPYPRDSRVHEADVAPKHGGHRFELLERPPNVVQEQAEARPARTLTDYVAHHEGCDANKCAECQKWHPRFKSPTSLLNHFCEGVFTPKPCTCGLDAILLGGAPHGR